MSIRHYEYLKRNYKQTIGCKNYDEGNTMNLEVNAVEEKKTPPNEDSNEILQNEKPSSDIKEHENLTKTVTPTKSNHPLSWWLKWVSSIILIVAMIATTNNLYPWNMIFQFLGVGGWLMVAIIWNDRALIVINAIAVAIFANGIVAYILKTYYGQG